MRLMSRKRHRQRQRCRRRVRNRGSVALVAKRKNLPSQKDDNYQVVRGIAHLGLPEMVNTPMLSGKFLHLKDLQISLVGTAAYDYFPLASFLDASPHLENFVLTIPQHSMQHDSFLGGPSHDLRQIPEQRYDKLKNVKISGFCSVKSLVDLTCHILENTTSLECLALDTSSHSRIKCAARESGKCYPLMDKDSLVEA